MSHPRFFIYGPPGSGKSTLIAFAKRLGYTAVDLEGDNVALLGTDAMFYGMAGESVHDTRARYSGPQDFHILLLPQLQPYERRLEERDAAHPEKKGQRGPTVWPAFAADTHAFDFVADTTDMSVGDTIYMLLSVVASPDSPNVLGREFSRRRTQVALGMWAAEEAQELIAARDSRQALDAVFDCLGVLIIYLLWSTIDDVRAAHAAYVESQVKRGRDTKVPHHAVIARTVSTIATISCKIGYPAIIIEYAIKRAESGGFRVAPDPTTTT